MHKAKEMKLLFWNTAKAYNEMHFKQVVDDLKLTLSKVAYNFLAQNPRSFL